METELGNNEVVHFEDNSHLEPIVTKIAHIKGGARVTNDVHVDHNDVSNVLANWGVNSY